MTERESLFADGLSQFKLGLLEGLEAIALGRPTNWRASGIGAVAPPDEPFWLPPVEALAEFNAGVEAGFKLAKGGWLA